MIWRRHFCPPAWTRRCYAVVLLLPPLIAMATRRTPRLLLLALCTTQPLFAADLDIAVDATGSKSIFGLPPQAREADLRRLLGEPAAVIAMSKQRHGLLYGTNLMLIFDNDRLWQARTWFINAWSPQLYHGWLQYIPPATTRTGLSFSSFSINQGLKLGAKRAAMEQLLGKAYVDAHEFSTVARYGDAEVWLGYAYPEESDAKRDMSTQTVVSLVIEYTGVTTEH